MLSAYVLILTEVGKVAHVAQALRDLDGVQVAEDITGPYDVIAKVQASGLDQLGRLVASRIQAVDGVTRTLQLHSDPPVAEEAVATNRHAILEMRPGKRTPEGGTAGSNTASAR